MAFGFSSFSHPSIPLFFFLCLHLRQSSSTLAHSQSFQHLSLTTFHSHLGSALLLPLSRPSSNASLSIPKSAGHRRELVGSPEAHARMTLYDDLLTKGYYTGRLWIGTPPQEFALIVDTGSTVTYVPCSSCTHCGVHQDPGFKPEASTSYKPVDCGLDCMSCDTEKRQCKYERRYAEMSTSSGLLGNDLVSFGKDSTLGPERLVFGCETAETGDIYEQAADGIMGLGRGHLSIVDQLVGHNAMANAFSLCYGGMDEGGGAMIMGAIPSPPAMVYTKSDFKRSGYYNLGLQEVRVAGTSLPVDPGVFDAKFGTVLDSGTTFAYFPEKAFMALKNALVRQLGKLQLIPGPEGNFPDVCFASAGNVALSELSSHFPQVDLKFGDGKILSLAPENYLFKHSKVSGAYCLGIFNNGKDSATLLGGIIVRNMLVTYDRANQQIGFWKTNCSDLWNNLLQVVPSHGPLPPPLGPSVAAPVPQSGPALTPRLSAAQVPFISDSACVSGRLEIEMLVGLNYTAFEMITSDFVSALSHWLDVDMSQVKLINFRDAGTNVNVSLAVFFAVTDKHLLNSTAERIISHLKQHEVHFDASFGKYQITGYRVISTSKRPSLFTGLHLFFLVVASIFVAVVIGASVISWWYFRTLRGQMQNKYVTVDQQNIEMLDQL